MIFLTGNHKSFFIMLRILVVMNVAAALWVSKMDSGVSRCLTSWMCLFLPFIRESSVQSLSHIWLFVTPWTATRQASLSITNSWSLLKLMSIESAMLSNYLILCHPLLLLPSIFPSIRLFSNESVLCIRWPTVLEFQLEHQSFQWIFRTDFL